MSCLHFEKILPKLIPSLAFLALAFHPHLVQKSLAH